MFPKQTNSTRFKTNPPLGSPALKLAIAEPIQNDESMFSRRLFPGTPDACFLVHPTPVSWYTRRLFPGTCVSRVLSGEAIRKRRLGKVRKFCVQMHACRLDFPRNSRRIYEVSQGSVSGSRNYRPSSLLVRLEFGHGFSI